MRQVAQKPIHNELAIQQSVDHLPYETRNCRALFNKCKSILDATADAYSFLFYQRVILLSDISPSDNFR